MNKNFRTPPAMVRILKEMAHGAECRRIPMPRAESGHLGAQTFTFAHKDRRLVDPRSIEALCGRGYLVASADFVERGVTNYKLTEAGHEAARHL